jgi:hypothetical protein
MERSEHIMNRLVIRDDDHALVEVDLERSMFRLVWKCQAPSEALRKILIQAHMQVVQHRLRYWLSDSRALVSVPEEDEDWIRTVWTPQIFLGGLERLAIVPSRIDDYRTAVDRIVQEERPRTPFPVKFFEHPDQALGWLLGSASNVD